VAHAGLLLPSLQTAGTVRSVALSSQMGWSALSSAPTLRSTVCAPFAVTRALVQDSPLLGPRTSSTPTPPSSTASQMRPDRQEHHGRPSTCSTAVPATTRPPYDAQSEPPARDTDVPRLRSFDLATTATAPRPLLARSVCGVSTRPIPTRSFTTRSTQ
jgi:hypothetical protein